MRPPCAAKFPGGTQEQYKAVHDSLDVGRPDGCIVHSAGPIDGGWGVIDFWDSTEAFERFVEGKLMPAVQQLGERGFPSPPERKEFPVQNLEQY